MFKKFVAMCGVGLILPISSAFAVPDNADLQPMSKVEAESSNDIIEQLLNSIEQAKIDFQVVATSDSEKGFLLDALTVEGLVQFNSDWSVDLTENEADKQLKKVVPKIHLDGKNLIAAANVTATNDFMNIDLDFYDYYDKKSAKWVPRPLTVVISNQLNTSLITLKFTAVHAQITQASSPGEPNKIKGSCYSEKKLTDFTTGKTMTVPVKCEFDGYYTDKGHKINFKYVNAARTVGLKP